MTDSYEVLRGFQAGSFVKDHHTDDIAAETAAQVFFLDLQEAMPSVVRMRDWALAMLAPRSGETAVDVGSGAGSEVRRFAALVGPDGRAVGVEPHEGLRAVAIERAAGTNATYVPGSTAALPFDDGSVDVLSCERVFQHLPDPEGAVAEFVRVLAPGGRVVLIDSDWGSMVVTPGDPDVIRRANDFRFSQAPNPFAGRHFVAQLTRAGLQVDPDVAATAVVPPSGAVLMLLQSSLPAAVADGAITQEESDRLIADISAAGARGEAFIGVTMFGVCGRKL
jgi:ubiquinone/menaquinone biosynthesis C-methylase UbiE